MVTEATHTAGPRGDGFLSSIPEATDLVPPDYAPPIPVNTITVGDVTASLKQGWADFTRAIPYGVFFGGVYVLGGLALIYGLSALGFDFLVFPVTSGFLLIGPMIAVGLYEISRRLEDGESIGWSEALFGPWRRNSKHLILFGASLAFVMIVWLKVATLTYALFFGVAPVAFEELLSRVFTTQAGLWFLLVGNISGAILAACTFGMSVIAVPMLLDRNVDFMTAIATSWRAVMANKWPMLVWAVIIGVALTLSFATALIGMIVALPVIGHASWHLYRKVIPADVPKAS